MKLASVSHRLVVCALLGWAIQASAQTLPDLRTELLERSARDQAIRRESIQSGADRPDPKISERMREIDRDNTARVQAIVKEHGWPGPDLIGRDGTHAVWLIVQHSTPEFQAEMLPLVKAAYEAGQLSGSNYALLQDRVLVHAGKKQIYGSQGRWDNGVLGLSPIEDEANVDQRRAEVGLGPLADYLKGMREMYRSKEPRPGATGSSSPEPNVRRMVATTPYRRLVELEHQETEARAALEAATDEAEKAKRRGQLGGILSQLAWARSTVGDYAGALAASRGASNPSGRRPPPPTFDEQKVTETLQGYEARDAVTAIVEAARDRQIVILNEAHHISRHRAFALLLARELRKAGFQYLACETFTPNLDAEAMRTRQYPTQQDGYYTKEPLFGDFVRESLRLGYVPVPYEYSGRPTPGGSAADSINAREAGEAANLMELFKKDPAARVFIYVGFSHLMKKAQQRPAEPNLTVEWMARRLQALSGIEPLTIDQVSMTDPEPGSLNAALLQRVFSTNLTGSPVLVLRNKESAKHLVLGTYAGDADLQIFHAPTRTSDRRPDWLAMNGYRHPHPIPAELLPKSGRRLVQAFSEDERESPIAMDQLLVEAGQPIPVFMLPPGKYRYTVEE
jgi:hypothetical protein